MKATHRDDLFHPPTQPDPTWGETAWFAFAAPERGLAGTLYPLFRNQLGICALGVAVWDTSAYEPWHVRYARRLWHVPIPKSELDDFTLEGLSILCLEPLSKYRLAFKDGDKISVDLEYRGLIPPHAPIVTPERGHIDQPCHVTGSLRLGDEHIAIDCFEMRDRSWGPRDDLRRTRASYSYGIAGPDESFLASTRDVAGVERIVMGFLVRGGEKHDLVAGTREVLARNGNGFPERVRIEATDDAGRTLDVEGECVSRLAEQATPGMFAWMSLTRWSGADGSCYGQDQEIWSPDTWPIP
jgi:hypothetical protein